MKVKNQKQKIDFKDWKFWFKFLSGVAVLGMILAMYLKEMIELGQFKADVLNWFGSQKGLTLEEFERQLNLTFGKDPQLNWISIVPLLVDVEGTYHVESLNISAGFGEYTVQTFSYFTTLSNVAVGVWFIVAAFKPHKEGKSGFVNYESTLIVATTITITMLIWLGMLLPNRLANGDTLNWWEWFSGLAQHAVFPLLLILYVCLVWKPNQVWTNKEYMKNAWWKLIVVIVVYGVYALVRGEMRYQGGRPYDTQYPYFFLRIHESEVTGLPGVAWFVLALSIIIGICLGFSIGYNSILQKRFGTKTIKNRN